MSIIDHVNLKRAKPPFNSKQCVSIMKTEVRKSSYWPFWREKLIFEFNVSYENNFQIEYQMYSVYQYISWHLTKISVLNETLLFLIPLQKVRQTIMHVEFSRSSIPSQKWSSYTFLFFVFHYMVLLFLSTFLFHFLSYL